MSKYLCLCLSAILAILIGCQGLQPAKTSEQPPAKEVKPAEKEPAKSCQAPAAKPSAEAPAKPCAQPAEKKPAPAPAAKSTDLPAEKVADIIIDNADPGFKTEGYWDSAAAGRDHKEDSVWAYGNSQEANAKAIWTPDIKVAGTYEVLEWHGDDPNADHATKAPFTVTCAGGAKTILADLTKNIGQWNSLGTFKFEVGKGGNITLTNKADGNVLADAIKLVYKGK